MIDKYVALQYNDPQRYLQSFVLQDNMTARKYYSWAINKSQ